MIKVLKTVWVALLVFSLSGCFYQSVSENDWDKATRICAEHRGVDKVNSHFNGNEYVICKNGNWKELP